MKITAFLIVFYFSAIFAIGQVSFGDPIKIDEDWKFSTGDFEKAQQPEFNDSRWKQIDLPHDWSVEGQLSPSLASATGYLPGGIAWYRKILNIPAGKTDKKVYVYFEGVYRNAEVFINGTSVGMRPNGYISYMYDLTPYIKFGEKNILAVRVDHSKSADSRWYTGSGIYRDVYLVYANPVHIDLWGVYYTSKIDNYNLATLQVQTSVTNTSNQKSSVLVVQELFSKENKSISRISKKLDVAASQKADISEALAIKNPELWSLENPYLYQLVTSVYNGKTLIDRTTTNVGLRTLSFDANKGFSLNGKNMKVKGVCMHHDAGCLGSAVPEEVWESRLKMLKAMGCNAIRTSHNPQAPVLYNLCDKLGLLIFNEAFDEWEFSKKKWIEGWNVGTPGFQGPSEFFEQWGETDLKDMVLRDRNHPSVFMWSIGNEVDYPNDPYSHPVLNQEGIQQQHTAGYLPDHPKAERLGAIAKRLAAVVRKYDTSRPVSAGLAGPVMSNETDYPFALDVCGYNYTERRYVQDHAKYPKRVLFGSENSHDMDAWKAVRDNEYIFGQFLWTGFDYLGESFAWPSRGFSSGLIDLGGNIKPRGYFRQSLWSEKPVIYLGTYKKRNDRYLSIDAPALWNYNDGDTVRVVCYTNCKKVQLLLNGEKIGNIKDYDDVTGIISWDIPFKPGKLEAIGYNQETLAAQCSAETSKQPFAINAHLVSKSTAPKGVSIVEIQIVDENGKPVFISDNEITCNTKGPIKLIGMEASNPRDMSDYNDNKQRVFQGKMVVFVRNTGENGNAEMNFTSPWLKGCNVSFSN
jgi:hypothetical protein